MITNSAFEITIVACLLVKTGDCAPALPIMGDTPPDEGMPRTASPDVNGIMLDEKTMICQEHYQSPDYVWEPVQEVCVSCRLCAGSIESFCQSCKEATTAEVAMTTVSPPPQDLLDDSVVTTAHRDATPPLITTPLGAASEAFAIVSIVIGTLIAVVVICAIAYFARKRNKKRNGTTSVADPSPDEGEACLPERRGAVPQQEQGSVPEFHPLDPAGITGSSAGHRDTTGGETWV